MRIIPLSIAISVALFSAANSVQAEESGTAHGRLVIGDKTIPLSFVYANVEETIEELQGEEPQKSVTILICAEKIPALERTNRSALEKRAREGKLHAIELHYDPETKRIYRGAIFYKEADRINAPLNILFNNNANYRFDNFSLSSDAMSGEAQMVEPRDWPIADTPEKSTPKKYTYSFSFRTPVALPAPITADLSGSAAASAPQVTVGAQFVRALYTGDFATIRKISLSPSGEGTPQEKEMARAFARMVVPTPDEFARQPKHVVVRGDTATLVAGTQGDTVPQLALKMVRKGGKWVISE